MGVCTACLAIKATLFIPDLSSNTNSLKRGLRMEGKMNIKRVLVLVALLSTPTSSSPQPSPQPSPQLLRRTSTGGLTNRLTPQELHELTVDPVIACGSVVGACIVGCGIINKQAGSWPACLHSGLLQQICRLSKLLRGLQSCWIKRRLDRKSEKE